MKKFLVLLTMLAMSFSLGNALAQENGLSQKVSENRDYPKRQEGKNQNLPIKNKYPSQDYALMSPFFQDLKSGFCFFGRIRQHTAKRS